MTSTKKSSSRPLISKNGNGGKKRTFYSDDSESETPPTKAKKYNLQDFSDSEEEIELVEKRKRSHDNTIWYRAYAFISRYTTAASRTYLIQCLKRAFSYIPHFAGAPPIDDQTPPSDHRVRNSMSRESWNCNSSTPLPMYSGSQLQNPPLKNGLPLSNNVKGNPYKSIAEDSSTAENCSVKSSKGGSNSFSSVQDSIRLKEKEQYKMLIQQYTQETLALKPQKTVISTHNKDAKVQVDLHSLEGSVNSGIDHLRNISYSPSKEIKPSRSNLSIERLTSPESSLLRERLRKRNETVTKPYNESYIAATTSQAKKSLIVNGLSSTSKLSSSPFISNDWLNELKSSLHSGKEERQHLISTYENLLKEHQQKREAKLELLDKRIRERTAKRLQAALKETEEEEEEPYFPEITPEMEQKIEEALCNPKPDQVLVEGFRLSISRKDMETLTGLNWLNDEIINFYMNLLMERSKQVEGLPSVYAFNTFFYPKLVTGGHATLKRWTRKLDIFSFDLILVPVHMGMHWCLAVIDFRHQKLQYYDSLGGKNMECLTALVEYLKDERMDKKKEDFDMTGWSLEFVKKIPLQMNGSDCGMFTLKYAEYITRDAKINFNQTHMPYFRRRMIYEIMTKTLL